MKVTVTQDHIDRGNPASPCYCPIALAVKDLVTSVGGITVGCATVRIYNANHVAFRRFMLPKEAKDFIWRFDSQEPVDPFEFEMKELA